MSDMTEKEKKDIVKRITRRAKACGNRVYPKGSTQSAIVADAYIRGYLQCEKDYERWREDSINKDQEY